MSAITTAGAVAPITNAAGAGAALAEHAEAIRALGKRVIGDVLEIGQRLAEAKACLKHGRWSSWLEEEFGWSDDTAANYIRAYKLTQEEEFKYRNFRDLNIGVSALYLISQQSVPVEARTEIIERAEAGEVLPIAEVKRVIESDKKPATAKKASTARAAKTATTSTVAAIAKNNTTNETSVANEAPAETTSAVGAGNDVDTEASAERRKPAAADAEAIEPASEIVTANEIVAGDDEKLALLSEFARLVIDRATAIRFEPKDHAKYKVLRDRVKQALGGGK